METIQEYHTRRIAEIHKRITVLQGYISNSSALKCDEASVGLSYKKRRNSRNAANSNYRISEFASELNQLKINLGLHQKRLSELV